MDYGKQTNYNKLNSFVLNGSPVHAPQTPIHPPPLKFLQRSQLGKNPENVDFSLNNQDYVAGRQS